MPKKLSPELQLVQELRDEGRWEWAPGMLVRSREGQLLRIIRVTGRAPGNSYIGVTLTGHAYGWRKVGTLIFKDDGTIGALMGVLRLRQKHRKHYEVLSHCSAGVWGVSQNCVGRGLDSFPNILSEKCSSEVEAILQALKRSPWRLPPEQDPA